MNFVRGTRSAVGSVETRRGEDPPPSLPTPTWRFTWGTFTLSAASVRERGACVLSTEILTSVVLRKFRSSAGGDLAFEQSSRRRRVASRLRRELPRDLALANGESSCNRSRKSTDFPRRREKREDERTLENSPVLVGYHERTSSRRRIFARARVARVARTVLIKVLRSLRQQVSARVSKGDGLCPTGTRIFSCWSVLVSREDRAARAGGRRGGRGGGGREEAPLPATGKSCLPIPTCVQGRPRGKTRNCSRYAITIVSQ